MQNIKPSIRGPSEYHLTGGKPSDHAMGWGEGGGESPMGPPPNVESGSPFYMYDIFFSLRSSTLEGGKTYTALLSHHFCEVEGKGRCL